MTTYPTKTFVWRTMLIMTSSDNARNLFNEKVRSYASTHDIVLFDIVAIEADEVGKAAGTNNEVMATSYSTDGGHLKAAGSLRAAKALWVMMARIAK